MTETTRTADDDARDRALDRTARLLGASKDPRSRSGRGAEGGWVDLSGQRDPDITESVEPGDTFRLESRDGRIYTKTVQHRNPSNGVVQFADGTTYQPHIERYNRVEHLDESKARDDEGGTVDEVRQQNRPGQNRVDEGRGERDPKYDAAMRDDVDPGDVADELHSMGFESSHMDRSTGAWTMRKDRYEAEYFQDAYGDFKYRLTGGGERVETPDPEEFLRQVRKLAESTKVSDTRRRIDEALDAGTEMSGDYGDMGYDSYETYGGFGYDEDDDGQGMPDEPARHDRIDSPRGEVTRVGPAVESLDKSAKAARKLAERTGDGRLAERLGRLADRCDSLQLRHERGEIGGDCLKREAAEAFDLVEDALEAEGVHPGK